LTDEVKLPVENTPTNLPDEATESKCVVKSGEVVELLNSQQLKMPDGTIREDLKGCELEKGSSLIFHYGSEENKKSKPLRTTKPKTKIHPAPVVPTYMDTTPVVDNSSDISSTVIIDSPNSKVEKVNAAIDPMTATIVALAILAATITAGVSSSISKIRGKNISDLQNHNKKRKEDQSKCNSRSDRVNNLIMEVDKIVQESPANSINIEDDSYFNEKSLELNIKMKSLVKEIRSLEDRISKIKVNK
jgi:hypothetical protein